MILNRIRKAIDPKLRYNQCGFREKRTTVAQIFALRRIMEEVKKNNLPAVITFIDFRKAFDSIHRGKMMRILKAYGIPPNLLRAIEATYTGTKAKVVTPDGTTDEFELLAGVLQGDTLAPFLFIIVLDYALRMATTDHEELGFTVKPKRSRRDTATKISDLDFADDIALLSDDMPAAQELLTRVEAECSKTGLHLNAKKTEFMAYNTDCQTPLSTSTGDQLKQVKDFKYLGARMESTERDIRERKALAWRALNRMNKIWDSNFSKSLKTRMFIASIETILLYGSETWTLTAALTKSLDGCYTRMLYAIYNINQQQQHITNKDLYGEIPKVSDKIAARRLKLAGHCLRHPELPASHVVLWEPTHGRKGRGRPPKTMVDTLKVDAGVEDTNKLRTIMQDRDGWRVRCCVRLRST